MTQKIARYSPELKFQVVLEALSNEKTVGQIAKAYNVHPHLGRPLEENIFRTRSGDLCARNHSHRIRAPHRRTRAIGGQKGGGNRPSKKLLAPEQMSTAQKVEHAAAARKDFGLNLALKTLGLAKATWYYHPRQKQDYATKYAHLRNSLEAIAREHPEYGYRRTTPELRQRLQRAINHKVVQHLQKLSGLPLLRGARRPEPSGIRQAITAAAAHIPRSSGWSRH